MAQSVPCAAITRQQRFGQISSAVTMKTTFSRTPTYSRLSSPSSPTLNDKRRLPSKVEECLTELEPLVDGFRIMDEAVTNKRSAHGHGVTEYLNRAPTVLESRYH
ncbi:hypothetical protein K457DRAFT_18520 [Linnemannia elongata AG-77]|uniref:Uncharacterized protein n=1 Tax=Linnemannia elongata AG-77 TaxID=1314771 RepID=A0A197JYZ3_9FUNG|nr:hypothetical protein K457DRAFT_18520 [Linnemannia elongata AG-77]